MTHHGGGSALGTYSRSRSDDVGSCDLVAAQVSRVVLDELPSLFGTTMLEMIEMMDNLLQTLRVELLSGLVGGGLKILRVLFRLAFPQRGQRLYWFLSSM